MDQQLEPKQVATLLKAFNPKNPEDLRKIKDCLNKVLQHLSNNQDKSIFQLFLNETQKSLFPRFLSPMDDKTKLPLSGYDKIKEYAIKISAL